MLNLNLPKETYSEVLIQKSKNYLELTNLTKYDKCELNKG